jgi:hypothetical protein
VEFDMLLLVIAGIAAVVAGAVAIWFGIPVKEFSFGNTMILAGAVAICNGLLLIGLGFVIRELKAVRLSLRERPLEAFDRETEGHLLPAGSIARRRSRDEFGVRHVASEGLAPTAPRRQASRSDDGGSSAQDAEPSGIERGKLAPEIVQPVAPPAKARRNLLFSSSRKERGGEELAAEPPVGAPAAEPVIAADTRGTSQPHPSFDNTWPRTERSSRAEPTTSRRDATLAPPSRSDRASASEQGASTATVVKSGSVDGMAYSLYSDGSIEAQMPEGMMRFASIEKLRAHLDRST